MNRSQTGPLSGVIETAQLVVSSERYPLRPSTLELERWNTSASVLALCWSCFCSSGLHAPNAPPGANSGVRRRSARARSGAPFGTVRVEATRSR